MMWVGSFGRVGLCRFDRQTGKFLPDSFDVKGITSICKDKVGDLWIASGGLYQLIVQPAKPGQLSEVRIKHYWPDSTNPDSLNDEQVNGVYEDTDGILWIATNNGVISFDKKRNIFRRFQHDPKNIHSISSNMNAWFGENFAEDQEGNLWIATDAGINKLNKDRTAFTRYTHDSTAAHSLSSDLISSIFIDQSGILWAGTFKGKLNKANLIQKPFWQKRNIPGNINSLSNNKVTAICEDSSGIVWIGTDGGGLNRWDKKIDKFTNYKHDPRNAKSLRRDAVYAILEDRNGQLWVANGEFLSKLNKETGEFIHYNSIEEKSDHSYPKQIFSITEDHDGVIWLGADFRVINFDKKTGKFLRYYYHNEADSTSICDYGAISIFADSRNNIWMGHGSKGTDKLNNRTGIITHYRNNPNDSASISSNVVNSFYEDSKGNLWLATQGGGLCRFNYQTAKFTTYTDKNGLPDNSVYSVLEDNNNHLWLGTSNGLSRFDPIKEKITNYDEKDGLVNRVFAAGERDRPPHYKGKDGTLYFGGANGFNFFHPDQVKADSTLAPVVITQFKLFDSLVKGVNESNEIVLKHNENYFSFEFSSLSYANQEKNQYAYKLEGVDNDWVYSGSRHYTTYTNIAPGSYPFKVKATNSDGVWNEEGVSFKVIIQPPWWKTWWAYSVYGLLLIAAAIAIYRYQKQRVIRIEREKAQKKELEQAKEIEKAYHELKTTQQQLIQSEKMASLGELTAGIAHEIQNPLNFVNNFSEVNTELIDELAQEAGKGNIEEVKAIAKDIRDNELKIVQHGKRADAIVKGMLQHSRSSSGVKEPTDVNALCDEYLRLAYHGLRAKDKSFNAITKTEFDNTIGKINVMPQEIGRVTLNLINNAFYAVDEKKKTASDGYEPTVIVTTRKEKDKIEVKVKDNGNGIPQKVLDKIFQPFFTTKPTGQGTGLGLSLAYDIVKAHGGEIKVDTKEGEGSEFIVLLPLAMNAK
jgi:signal transduction histidine kinase/ligand-binding sensor domain-containing protein